MQPFTLQTTLTPTDWRAYQREFRRYIVSSGASAEVSPETGAEGSFPEPSFSGPVEFQFSAAGVRVTAHGMQSHSDWSRVKNVTATPEHVFLWLNMFMTYVVPIRGLPSDITSEQLIQQIREWMTAAASSRQTVVTELSAEAPATSPDTIAKAARWQSVRAVLRLLTLRRAEGATFSGRVVTIALLTLLSFVLWAGLGWLRYQPEPRFYPYEIPLTAWFVLGAMLMAVILAKRSRPPMSFSRACLLLAAIVPILLVVDFAIDTWLPERWQMTGRGGLGLYALAYCARGMQSLTGTRQPVAVVGALGVALLLIGVGDVLYVQPSLWEPAQDEYGDEIADAPDWSAAEEILFQQPARIDAAAAKVARSDGDRPEGFFVGFAGYGDQRVFAEEIKFASQVFADRYDTSSRSLLLINDRRDVETDPIASVSSLRYALKAVAARMQLDRDVLFLVLSSHGAEDPLLSVSNGPLPLHDLDGEALAEALRESGIKWRVIVISACHAGAFIESLQDSNTIVITAAAPDRTSFGCSDDRELTYFGEAFFRDSLPKARSLREAFEEAKQLVSDREREQGFEPSRPQAFFGEQIEPRVHGTFDAARLQ